MPICYRQEDEAAAAAGARETGAPAAAAAGAEEGEAAPCLKRGAMKLMLVAQRMMDVPGLALLTQMLGPDSVSAVRGSRRGGKNPAKGLIRYSKKIDEIKHDKRQVRFVESEEIPLSIIMSQGTLKTGALDGLVASDEIGA